MTGVLSRFSLATATTIQELKNSSKNENTVKSTAFWFSVCKKWCLEKRIAEEIKNYKPVELNSLHERFYAELKNKYGEDYELDRRLTNKGYSLSTIHDKNSVPPNKYCTEKRNSFAWLAASSAQTKLDSCPKRRKKFSGRARNSVVKLHNP